MQCQNLLCVPQKFLYNTGPQKQGEAEPEEQGEMEPQVQGDMEPQEQGEDRNRESNHCPAIQDISIVETLAASDNDFEDGNNFDNIDNFDDFNNSDDFIDIPFAPCIQGISIAGTFAGSSDGSCHLLHVYKNYS